MEKSFKYKEFVCLWNENQHGYELYTIKYPKSQPLWVGGLLSSIRVTKKYCKAVIREYYKNMSGD
jgi:hypothetical protein